MGVSSRQRAYSANAEDTVRSFRIGRKSSKKKAGLAELRAVPLLPFDFDSELYLEINTDVAKAGVDAAVHYVYQGMREGRAYRYPEGESPAERG